MQAEIITPIPHKEPEPPENLAGKITARIQKIATGNGLNTATIKTEISQWHQYDIQAELVLSFAQENTTETLPGKVAKGEVMENKAKFDQSVSQALPGLLSQGSLVEMLTKEIKQSPLAFIKTEEGQVPSQYNRVFTVHEKCGKCLGNGSDTCHSCAQRGQITCASCSSSGRVICNNCRGTGYFQQGADRQMCTLCGGNGRVACAPCRGAGRVTCNHCHGKGKIICHTCEGAGWFSEVMTITFSWVATWHLIMPEVRASLQRLLQKGWKLFYEKKEVELLPIEGPVTEQPPVHSRLIYLSMLQAQAGEAKIRFGEKEIPASILGTEGRLFDIPNFLDGVAKRELQRLQKGLRGGGNLLQATRKALSIRFVREAFGAALGGKQAAGKAQAARNLLRFYPHGLSYTAAEKLAEFASATWDKLTEKARIGSLAMACVFGLLLEMLYWCAPLYGMPSFAAKYTGVTLQLIDAGACLFVLLLVSLAKPVMFGFATSRLRKVLSLDVNPLRQKQRGSWWVYLLLMGCFAGFYWYFRLRM